jgi:serine/threonine-protein kinase SRPK3
MFSVPLTDPEYNNCLQVYELAMGNSMISGDIRAQAVPYLHTILFGDYPLEMIKQGKHSDFFFNKDGP